MEDPIDRGLPFEIYDLWRQSIFTAKRTSRDDFFGNIDLELPSLDRLDNGEIEALEGVLDINLAPLNGLEDTDLQSLEAIEAPSSATSPRASEPAEDTDALYIWDSDATFKAEREIPRLRTWEAFEKKPTWSAERSALLSEAGQDAFDSFLASKRTINARSGVLPQDATLGSLQNLVLGRSSVFFQWNAEKGHFQQILQDVAISGLSLQCTHASLARLIEFGSRFRRLQNFATSAASWTCSYPSLVAFKGAVSSILGSVEEWMSDLRRQTRSLLQLQANIERSRNLLHLLEDLKDLTAGCTGDESLIAVLSTAIEEKHAISASSAEALKQLLARVSAPWLEHLMHGLGLATGCLDGIDKDHSFAVVDRTNASFDQSDAQESGRPSFIDGELWQLVCETKVAVMLLRDHIPDHPVVSGIARTQGLSALSPTTAESAHGILMHVKCYEQNIMDAIRNIGCVGLKLPATVATADMPSATEENMAWTCAIQQQKSLADLDSRMSSLPDTSGPERDAVSAATHGALSGEASSSVNVDVALFETDLLGPVRPLIAVQWRLCNGALIRHIFRDLHFRKHLDLQRDSHLLGNGNFVARLCTALFSEDTQSAERRRGNVPTGEVLGLRLGATEGQRWPPASSEVRLTLMGVLTESYNASRSDPDGPSAKDAQNGLLGGMSFAIRELSDPEIDRVVDAWSVYALDFLRLQYTAPPPLDAILTTATMQRYDDIFRFMLRLLRMLHVTSSLQNRLLKSPHPHGLQHLSHVSRFVLQARHVVETLMSHFMYMGMSAPWRRLMSELDELERTLAEEDAAGAIGTKARVGVEGLHHMHEQCLEAIRSGLFLRQKHHKVRQAIEELFTVILKAAAAISGDGRLLSSDDFTPFNNAVRQLMETLQAASEKLSRPGRSMSKRDNEESDSELAQMLLARLNWNRFYGDPETRH